jgi:hypothetical protein
MVAVAGIGVCLVYAAYELGGGTPDQPWGQSLRVALGALVPLLVLGIAFGPGAAGYHWREPFGGWLFTAALGIDVLLGVAAWRRAARERNRSGRVRWLIRLALAAPVVLILASWWVPGSSDNEPGTLAYAALVWLTITVTWVIALGWMADPNALALHSFYKARLVRAYLGASNPRRRQQGADINDPAYGDDLDLSAALRGSEAGGPYHLVNTALNLVGGRDLTTAQRSAASFLLSPLFCGSVRTGYRRTTEYMRGAMTLGAAVAASGAAASPNMGARTPSAALAMLLALFNVRLGLWVPTPHREHWRSPQARVWPYYLLRESLSQTNDLVSYCYLTDGGHFDNTGLYALVERACRYIVVVDDGADPEPCFEDIGDAIRRCRIDFGAEIELDASGFRRTQRHLVDGDEVRLATITLADGRRATVHTSVGSVRYAPAHLLALGRDPEACRRSGSDVGTIVWIKPALTGDEGVDVMQYGLQNAAFPQQTTADQWFDEAQFESYRRLGQHSAAHAFAGAVEALASGGPVTQDDVPALFARRPRPAGAPLEPSRLRALVRLE